MAVVTISRQFGAGGKTLGSAVAERLGIPFIDNELIQMVAEKARVSENWVAAIEREAGGKLQKFISRLVSRSLVERVLADDSGYIDEAIYVDLLTRIIHQIADEGDAVILGRGGQYVLQRNSRAVHVLLVADKHDRIRFIEEHYEMPPAKAVRLVNAEDRRRAALYRKFGEQNYDSPALYHLVLNMSRLHMDAACGLVCRTAQQSR